MYLNIFNSITIEYLYMHENSINIILEFVINLIKKEY